MTGRIRRPDLCNRTIAERWLSGSSHLDLSIEFDCTVRTINDRIAKAREQHPDLPWDAGKAPSGTDEFGSIKKYVQMNDGKPGESVLREGSIIKSSRLRMRNR